MSAESLRLEITTQFNKWICHSSFVRQTQHNTRARSVQINLKGCKTSFCMAECCVISLHLPFWCFVSRWQRWVFCIYLVASFALLVISPVDSVSSRLFNSCDGSGSSWSSLTMQAAVILSTNILCSASLWDPFDPFVWRPFVPISPWTRSTVEWEREMCVVQIQLA